MKLFGLVLAGGKSTRMGFDKNTMDFHGEPQVQWLYELLQKFCDDAFVSGNSETIPGDFKFIRDRYETGGPMNGILSALHNHGSVAWLVLPIDMPNLDETAVSFMLQNRETEKQATCFLNEDRKTIEPLPVIIEPSAYTLMFDWFNKKNSSLNDFLKNGDVKKVIVKEIRWLKNVNTPDQLLP